MDRLKMDVEFNIGGTKSSVDEGKIEETPLRRIIQTLPNIA